MSQARPLPNPFLNCFHCAKLLSMLYNHFMNPKISWECSEKRAEKLGTGKRFPVVPPKMTTTDAVL
jgi:hypothetical protein